MAPLPETLDSPARTAAWELEDFSKLNLDSKVQLGSFEPLIEDQFLIQF